jgi:hypothetical protein
MRTFYTPAPRTRIMHPLPRVVILCVLAGNT